MFQFYDLAEIFPATDPDTLVAEVPVGLRSLGDILAALGKALSFPPHFGKNLDAFWDCVRTMDNVSKHHIVVAHREIPSLPRPDLNGYVVLLRDAGIYWERSGGEHIFEAWFPHAARGKIRAILRNFPLP